MSLFYSVYTILAQVPDCDIDNSSLPKQFNPSRDMSLFTDAITYSGFTLLPAISGAGNIIVLRVRDHLSHLFRVGSQVTSPVIEQNRFGLDVYCLVGILSKRFLTEELEI